MNKRMQIFTFCSLTLFSAAAFAQDWQEIGGSEASPEISTAAASFTRTPDGKFYAAYSDGNLSQRLTVKEFNGKTWNYIGKPGESSEGKVYDVSIVSLNGTLYEAYRDDNLRSACFVKKFDGKAWVPVGTKSAPEYSGENQLAVSGNTLYWYCNERGRSVVRKLEGNDWVETGALPGTQKGSADAFDMAVNNGQLYLAYTRDDDYPKRVQLVKLGLDNKWVTVGPLVTDYTATAVQLAFDDLTNMPLIVARNDNNGRIAAVKLAKNKDKKDYWESVGPDNGFVGKNYDKGLTLIIRKGTPYVAWQESNENAGKALAFVNGAWIPAASTVEFAPNGEYPTFNEFFQDANKLYIVYRTSKNSRGTIKELAK